MGRCISEPYASQHASNDAFVVDYEAELSYWRAHYRTLPSCAHLRLEDVRPAIKVALDACLRARGRGLDEMWESTQTRYQRLRERSCLEWSQARSVVEAVWNRLHERGAGEREDFEPSPASRLIAAPQARMRQQFMLR